MCRPVWAGSSGHFWKRSLELRFAALSRHREMRLPSGFRAPLKKLFPREDKRMGTKKNSFELIVSKGTDRVDETVPPQKAEEAFRNATRIQESLTSGFERRALMWIAARMASRLGAGHLACIGLCATVMA